MALLLKRTADNLPSGSINEVVLQMVYGNLRKPPGAEKSPYEQLLFKKDEEFFQPGIWAPPNSLAKGLGLKWLFPSTSGPFKIQGEKPLPLHIAVAYDAYKYKDVMEISAKFPGQVLKYGFFSSDILGDAQLLAKTVEKFENRTVPTTYEEKIIIQLAKTNPECLDAFTELGPSYLSPSAVEGEEDCKIIFPTGYDEPEPGAVEVKKKSKKKTKSPKSAAPEINQENVNEGENGPTPDSNVAQNSEASGDLLDEEGSEGGKNDPEDGEGDEDEEEEHDNNEGEAEVDEADKATSPMIPDVV